MSSFTRLQPFASALQSVLSAAPNFIRPQWKSPRIGMRTWLVVCLMLLTAPVMAADWYASHTGAGTKDCMSAANACAGIQSAIDLAAANDTVHVASGSYAFTATITINKSGLSVVGDASPFAATSTPAIPALSLDASIILGSTGGTNSAKGMVWINGAQNVRVENLMLNVNHGKSNEGIVTSGNVEGLTLRNNWLLIANQSGGKRNAISLNMATGSSSDQNSTGFGPSGTPNVTIENNVVQPSGAAANAISSRGIVADGVVGIFRGNKIAATTQDVRLRYTPAGTLDLDGNYIYAAGLWITSPNAVTLIHVQNNHFLAPGAPGTPASPLTASTVADPDFASLKLAGSARPAIVENNEFVGYANRYRGFWIQNWPGVLVQDNVFTPSASYNGPFVGVMVGNKEVWNGGPAPLELAVTFLRNTFNAGHASANGKAILFVDDNDASGGATAGILRIGDDTAANANNFASGLRWYVGLDEHTCNSTNCSSAAPTNSPLGSGVSYTSGSSVATQGRPFKWNVTALGNKVDGVLVANMTPGQYAAIAPKIYDKTDNPALGAVDYGPMPIATTGTIMFAPTSFNYDGAAHAISASLQEDASSTCIVTPATVTTVGDTSVSAICNSPGYNVSATATIQVAKGVGTAQLAQTAFVYTGGAFTLTPSMTQESGASCSAIPATVTNAGTTSVVVDCIGANYDAHGSITVTVEKAVGHAELATTTFSYTNADQPVQARIAEEPATSCSPTPATVRLIGTHAISVAACEGGNYRSDAVTLTATVGGSAVHRTRDDAYFASVADALADADTMAGDTLELAPGTYGAITLTKSVHLVGSAGFTPAPSRPATLLAGPTTPPSTIIDGGNVVADGITVANGVTGASISGFEIRNFTRHCIAANQGNDGLSVTENVIHGCGSRGISVSGIAASGITNVTIDHNEIYATGDRAIVVWDGIKRDITITNNNVHDLNGCCGIELQDGTATGVTVTDNVVMNTGDSGMAFIQLTSGSPTNTPNTIARNDISNTGRFGMEIKIPNGSGAESGDGAIIVEDNIIVASAGATNPRDRAGIAVMRRSLSAAYAFEVDATSGVIVRNNNVSGFTNANAGYEGYGIVVEGLNSSVSGNTLLNNDIGLQIQQANPDGLPPGDSNQDAHSDWFGRGNAPTTCVSVGQDADANSISGSTLVDQRQVPLGAMMSGARVTNARTSVRYCTINSAIAAAQAGDELRVDSGTFAENVVVTKSVKIIGAGQDQTTIVPETFNPDCASGGSGSICTGGSTPASIVFLVSASNVEISDLAVDGINPDLAGHETAIAARNGIMTDFVGPYSGFSVHDTTVRNIYLRGIYSPAVNNTFEFRRNTVDNVRSDPSSIGIFNYFGGGTIADNHVSRANDAIASNWSKGTTFSNNVVTESGSGIHSDNSHGAGGSTNDLMVGNTVTCSVADGYGIWTFATYADVTIRDNHIAACAVGLGAFGGRSDSGTPVATTHMLGNSVDGTGAFLSTPGDGSLGAWLSTTTFYYGDYTNQIELLDNVIGGFDVGVMTQRGDGKSLTTTAHRNRIFGNDAGWVDDGDVAGASNGVSDFTNNWWGCNTNPTAGGGCDTASGFGTANPWLLLQISASPSIIGRGDPSTVTANLTHNSDNAVVAPVFPDGTTIAFATTAGSIAPASSPTTGGVAQTAFSNLMSGSATVTATLDNAVASTLISIAPALVVVDPATLNRIYDGSARAVSATTLPIGLGYSVTYDGNPTAPTDAGTYPFVVTVTDLSHEGSASGTLTIQKASGNVTFDNLALTYSGAAQTITAHITEEPGSSCVVTPTNVGPAAGSTLVSASCTGTNFDASATATAVIAKANATVVLSHLTQAQDGSPKSVVVTTTPANLPVSVTYASNAMAPSAVGSYAVIATITDANYIGSASGTLNIVAGTSDIALVLNGPVDPVRIGDTAQYAATMLANPALHSGETFGYKIIVNKSGGNHVLELADLATMEVFYQGNWVDATTAFGSIPFQIVGGELIYIFPDGLPGYDDGFPIEDPSWTWNFRFSFADTGTYTTTAELVDGISHAPIDPAVTASIATVVEDALPPTDMHLILGGPAGDVTVGSFAEYNGTLLADPSLHTGENFFVKVTMSKNGGPMTASDFSAMQIFLGGQWVDGADLGVTFTDDGNGNLVYLFPESQLPGGFPIEDAQWSWNFRFAYANTGVYTATAQVIYAYQSGLANPEVLASAAIATTVVAAPVVTPDMKLLLIGPVDDVEVNSPAEYTGTMLANPADFTGREFWVRVRLSKNGGADPMTASDLARMELYNGSWQDATAAIGAQLITDGNELVYLFPQPNSAFPIVDAIWTWHFRFTYASEGLYSASADVIDAADPDSLIAMSLANGSVQTNVVPQSSDITLQLNGPVAGIEVGQPAQYVGTLRANPLPDPSRLFFVEVRLHKSTGGMQVSDLSKLELYSGGDWQDATADLQAAFTPDGNDLVYLFPKPIADSGFPIDEAEWSWQFRFTYADAATYTATARVVDASDLSQVSAPVTISTEVAPTSPNVSLQLNGPVAGVETDVPAAYIGRLVNAGPALAENVFVKVRVELDGGTLGAGDVGAEVWDGGNWVPGFLNEVAGGLEVDFPDSAGFALPSPFDYTHQFRITYHVPGLFTASAQVVGVTSSTVYAQSGMYTQVLPRSAITASVLIDPASLRFVYDAQPHAATATTTPGVQALNLTYNGSTTPPTDAGTYVVIATVVDPLYVGSASAILVIDKAPSTITIDPSDLHQSAGMTFPVGAIANPMTAGASIALTYNGSTTVPSAVGSYTVVATLIDPNYIGSASAILVVGDGAQVTISIDDAPAMALIAANAPYTDLLPYLGSIGNAGVQTSQTVHFELQVVRIDDGNGSGGQPIAIATDDVLACVYDPSGWAAQDPDYHNGCPQDYNSLFLSQSTGSLNGRPSTTFRYPNLAQNDQPLPTINPASPMPPVLFAFKRGQYQVHASVVGSDGLVYATAMSGTTVPDVAIGYNGPSSGPVEQALLSQSTLTNAGGRVDGNVIVRVTLSDAGNATLAGSDATLYYQYGSNYLALPWTQAGNNLVTYYGPGTGFPLEDGHNATTSGQGIFHREGSYNIVYEVVDIATQTVLYASNQQAVTIGANLVNFSVAGLNPVYNGSPLPVTVSPASVPHTVSYEPMVGATCPSVPSGSDTTAPTDAGSYCVYVAASAPYSGTWNGTLVIAKATAMISIDDSVGNQVERGFNGLAQAVTATTDPSGLGYLMTYNGSTTAPSAAGSYALLASIDDANHNGFVTGTLIISAQGGASIVLDELDLVDNKIHRTFSGSAVAAVTASTTPANVAYAVTYTGDGSTVYPLTATPPTAVGQYHVAATTIDTNYAQVSAAGTLVIEAQAASIALDAATLSAVYDGSAHAVTATTTPAGLAYTVTYNGLLDAPSAAGSYTVVATITDPNHVGTPASGTLVISAINASISLDVATLGAIYDGNVHAVTATTSPSGLAYTVTYAGSATPPINAGSYLVEATITAVGHVGSATGTLVIGKAAGEVLFGQTSFEFDGSNHASSARIAQEPANIGACTITYAPAMPIEVSDNSTATATCDGFNYSASSSASLQITAKPVTLALAGTGSFPYSGTAYLATASVSGEVAGFPASLAIAYNPGGGTAPVAVGSYGVTASVIAGGNYSASPAAGVITIGAANATVLLADLSHVWNGSAQSASATTAPAGLAVSITYDGIATVPSAAGSYAVVATITAPGYSGSASGTLIIAKAPASVTLSDLQRTYDGSPKPVTVTTNPAGLSHDVLYDGASAVPSAVGNYAVQVTVTDANHSGSASGILHIGTGNAEQLTVSGAASFNGFAGQPLAGALPSVKATDSGGNPVAGVVITFVAGANNGVLSGAVQTTDGNGIATLGGWILDATPGLNSLSASAAGVAGAVTFTATGTVASGALSVSITDGRRFAKVGQALTYMIVVGNSGTSNLGTVAISNTLPAELDAAGAIWQCIPVNGAVCASGAGDLVDTINLPAGSSAVYLLSTSVVMSPNERISNTVTATGTDGAVSATDTTDTVLFRDGFEIGGDGAQSVGGELSGMGNLSQQTSIGLDLRAGATGSFKVITLASARDGAFRVEAITIDGHSWLRLVARIDTGEQASQWTRFDGEHAMLMLDGSDLLLIGSSTELMIGLDRSGEFSLSQPLN